jgi:hypothetical protein
MSDRNRSQVSDNSHLIALNVRYFFDGTAKLGHKAQYLVLVQRRFPVGPLLNQAFDLLGGAAVGGDVREVAQQSQTWRLF